MAMNRRGKIIAPSDGIIQVKSRAATMTNSSGNPKSYEERIVRETHVRGGESLFKGTRVTLRTVLASLAAGDTAEKLISDFPSPKPEDIQAAIAFAAASAE